MDIAMIRMAQAEARERYREYRRAVLAQWDLSALERSVLREGRR